MPERRHRVLFVCTHNSARSQIAEALLRRLGGDAFEVASAGSEPSGRVHPLALGVIAERGGDPARHRSKGLAETLEREWDLVVTVCDHARDACPILPPGATAAHWGMDDPSRREGSEAERLAAFRETARVLGDRIRLFISGLRDGSDLMSAAQGASLTIRDATRDDAAAIARIYNQYVRETTITFEEEPVSDGEMQSRITEVQGGSLPWLVAGDGGLLGYAHASEWKGRCAYRFSAEVTVYLDGGASGRGIGSRLYAELFDRLRAAGMHTVLAGIALPNQASVALHEKMGMVKVAHLGEVGFKLDRWVDVGYWQRTL